MISAKEARALAKKQTVSKWWAKKLEKQILKAIKNGRKYIDYDDYLNPLHQDFLLDLGYELKEVDGFLGRWFRISWGLK